MRSALLVTVFAFTLPAPAQTPACHAVAADQIVAKDLAAVLPAFAALPADAVLAPVPPPGSRRVFHAPELLSIAHRYSIALEAPPEVCFAWPMAPLDRSRVSIALARSLGRADARIEIAEMTASPVPPGELDFPRDHLGVPAAHGPSAPVLWRGDVVYGGGHRFPVWARVRIAVPCQRILAAVALRADQPLEARQLRVSNATCFPAADSDLTLDQALGLTPRRPLSAGSELTADLLAPPNDIHRGDSIKVEVFSGAAHLAFVGTAESAGRAGDFISVRNPSSNRIFRARVDGRGKAVVDATLSADTRQAKD